MAGGTKLVGSVGIKVRPVAKEFRKETEAEVKKALAGVEGKVPVEMELDEAAARKMKGDVKRKVKEADEEAGKVTIEVNYDDRDSLKRALEKLRSELTRAGATELEVELDEEHLREQIDEIDHILKEDGPKARIKVVNDRDGLEKAIAEAKAMLRQLDEHEVELRVDREGLNEQIDKWREEQRQRPIKLEVNIGDEASVRRARDELQRRLDIERGLHIEMNVDQDKIPHQLALLDAKLAAFEHARQRDIEIKVKLKNEAAAAAKAALLARDRNMNIWVKFRNATAFTFAKLTGLRAAARWTEEFGRAIGTMDRNLPIVAMATTAIGNLSSIVLALGSNMFTLGASIAQVGLLGLLGPAMLGGLGATMIVLTSVFKDFGAAVHGIDQAFKRLPPSGQQAALAVRKIFGEMREQMSSNFWDAASDSMLAFTQTALPAFQRGFSNLSTSMGQGFAQILNGFNLFAKNGGIDVQFALLTQGMERANKGASAFWNALNTLGLVGSTVFPRLGDAFTNMSTRFDNWVQRVAADGSLSSWINDGIDALKNMGRAIINFGQVWGNIAQAAEAAGGMTLQRLADGLQHLEDVTAGSRFQRNMQTIFEGAHQAMDTLFKAMGETGPKFDQFSQTLKNVLVNTAEVAGSAFKTVMDVLGSKETNAGLTSFLGGLKSMMESLRPAALPVANIIGTLGDLLGTVAKDSGPLFRDLFTQLASVFSAAWTSLKPFVPELVELGRSIVNNLGPALTDLANTLVPAVGQAFEALVPTIDRSVQGISGIASGIAKIPWNVIASDLASGSGQQSKDMWDKQFNVTPEDRKQAIDSAKKLVGGILDVLGSLDNKQPQWIKDLKDQLHIAGSLKDAGREAGPLMDIGAANMEVARTSEEAARGILAAERASAVLRDTSRDAAGQLNAMRESLRLLNDGGATSARDATQRQMENLNRLKDQALALKPLIADAGKALFNDKGLLDIESGNKAALAMRGIIRSSFEDTLVTAKNVYNEAIQAGKPVDVAIDAAMKAMEAGKGNLQQIADAAGLTVDQLLGEWNNMKGQDWTLIATFTGSTEQFKIAQEQAKAMGLDFDGQEFLAFLMADGNPANETKDQVIAHMREYGNSKWDATLGALPGPAQEQLRSLTGLTNEQWVNKDWTAIMRAAKYVPGLAEALAQMLAVKNGDYTAFIKAIADASAAQAAIQAVANARYVATIEVRSALPDLNGAVSGSGRFGTIAHGGILQGLRGMHGFNPGIKYFANGGFTRENHVAQIARSRPGMVRVWAENETGGEAYIPYAMNKRGRSRQILEQVASDFGYSLVKKFNNGGMTGTPSAAPSYHAPVTVGQIITTDPEAAMAVLQKKRRDAMAVANINPNQLV